jgi:hypothetical protein
VATLAALATAVSTPSAPAAAFVRLLCAKIFRMLLPVVDFALVDRRGKFAWFVVEGKVLA